LKNIITFGSAKKLSAQRAKNFDSPTDFPSAILEKL